MRDVLPLLMESNISADDKLRLIMLYVLYKNGNESQVFSKRKISLCSKYKSQSSFVFQGITDENLNRFLNNVTTPLDKKNIILNMQHLNLQIIQDPSRVSCKQSPLVYIQ